MVGDEEEVQGEQVLVSILAEKVSKPENSGFDRKGKMFESEEDDDPEVQEQIKTALASSGLLGDLQLSESEDESESDSPSSDDDEGDLNKTKQYYKDQEDEVAKDSGLKPDSSIPAAMDPPAMQGNPGNLDGSNPGTPARDTQPTKPIPSKGKAPIVRAPTKPLPPSPVPPLSHRLQLKESSSMRSQLFSGRPPWPRPRTLKKIRFDT